MGLGDTLKSESESDSKNLPFFFAGFSVSDSDFLGLLAVALGGPGTFLSAALAEAAAGKRSVILVNFFGGGFFLAVTLELAPTLLASPPSSESEMSNSSLSFSPESGSMICSSSSSSSPAPALSGSDSDEAQTGFFLDFLAFDLPEKISDSESDSETS